MGRKKAMRRMTMCSQRAAISIPRCVRRPMSSAVNRCPSPARSEMSDSSSEVLWAARMIRNIRSRMSLHRHVRPFLMPPAPSPSCTYSTRIAMARRKEGQQHSQHSPRVTFRPAGSEEWAHLRHMRAMHHARTMRASIDRFAGEEATFCTRRLPRRQRLPKCANVYSVEQPRASCQVANPQAYPRLTMGGR